MKHSEAAAYVSVPVPADRVLEVYQFLATTTREADGVDRTSLLLEVIERAVVESNTTTRRVLKYLAEQPDQWLTTSDLTSGLAIERKDLIGALSGLTRRMRGRYKQSGKFVSSHWDGQQAVFCIGKREAAAVLKAPA